MCDEIMLWVRLRAMSSYLFMGTIVRALVHATVRASVRDYSIPFILRSFNYEKTFLKVLNSPLFSNACFPLIYVFEVEGVTDVH